MRSWRIIIIRRGQVTSVGAILPSAGESRQVPVEQQADNTARVRDSNGDKQNKKAPHLRGFFDRGARI
jgi:hypothetical protein